jgi:aspartate/methionine/tyrosine aminotransferase
VQLAAPALFERGAAVREQIQARVLANYRYAAETASGTACGVVPAEGGWYAVLSVPALEPEEDLVVHLLETSGVLAHPGYFFDFPRESFLVVSLLAPERDFRAGTQRILRHFDCNA